jgi:hypothetical protein
MTESYEQLRDGATGDGGDAWRAADRLTGNLYSLYRELKEDPRYSDDYKAEKAWAAYDANEAKIEAERERAREHLEKQARSGERFGIPMPPGEAISTADTTKLLASQNEASRIVRKIDRIDDSGKGGPLKPDRLDVLRQEYARALETDGAEGAIVCRGVLSAADELGIDADSVVDGFRKDRHRESLERGQHAARLAQTIGGKVPEPPFSRPGASRGRGSNPPNRLGAVLVPRDRTTVAKPGGRHW